MRLWSAAVAALVTSACLALGSCAPERTAAPKPLTRVSPALEALVRPAAVTRIQTGKPGGGRPAGGGDDSCRFANDRECDYPRIGTGACREGTDVSDCRYLIGGETDACQHARDGECDEPGFGTGACTQGSDRTDCGDVARLRFRTDSCRTAFNNVCEEPGQGNGRCAARTDRRDCVGAQRPMGISDHFFGRDDRVFVNQASFPWRYVGRLRMDTQESCTATLIGEDVLITAAHCIHGEDGVNAAGRFVTAVGLRGGPYEARVTHYFVDPRFDYRRFMGGDEIDGLDWALLRIDRPLGRTLGFAGVRNLTREGEAAARRADLHQAGFSWDTGDNLAGHLNCHLVRVFADNTFAHECDTTRGQSGSPFMVRNGQSYQVIGVDSNFRSNPGGSFLYIAVSAGAFERHVADFTARRIGHPVGRRGGGEPPKK